MSTREDGGPAFPAPELGAANFNDRSAYPGMSLRDFFAAKAMQAIISAAGDNEGRVNYLDQVVAIHAYNMADAMLTARSSP